MDVSYAKATMYIVNIIEITLEATMGLTKRGSFEQLLSYTHKYYDRKGIARIDKIATPTARKGGELVYSQRSTVDYVGIAKGIGMVAFDAKETVSETFKVGNLHAHQVDYLTKVAKYGGQAFFLVAMKHFDRCFILPIQGVWNERHWKTRDSLTIDDFSELAVEVPEYLSTVPPCDYVTILAQSRQEMRGRKG